jgi:hypothetical protein
LHSSGAFTSALEDAMKIRGSLYSVGIAALGAASLFACMNKSSQSKTPAAVASCPLAEVPGVRTLVENTSDGVAIVVAGPDGQVDRIRQNVRAMATTNNNQGDPFAPCYCAMQPPPGAAEAMAPQAMTPLQAARIIPLSDAQMEQTPTGAILRLTPKDKNQADMLRARTREEVTALRSCLHNAEQQSSGSK